MIKKNRMVTIEVTTVAESEKGLKVEYDTGLTEWVPKSLCTLEEGNLTMPEWLAYKKGMI